MIAPLLLLLAAAPAESTAVMDLRGHTGEQIHRTLDEALPLLAACLKPAPVPTRRGAPVVVFPSAQEVVLAVSQSGAVASVEVKEPGRLDSACVVKEWRKLEFGRTAGSASMTLVRVPVSCDSASCRYPWTPKG